MTTRIAIIYPDTNLFLQCHPLKDLDWSSWASYDELHLMICRSVQRELDVIKKGTNDKATRARRAIRMVRTILNDTEPNYVVVKRAKPLVKLQLSAILRPSSELEEVLQYSKPDDELVGYAYRHREESLEADVFLLTHDTGPMATAKSVGLDYREIPDRWLIDSQQVSPDLEKQRLIKRIQELERQEPRIEFDVVNYPYERDGVIEIYYPIYDSLSQDEIDSHIQTIKTLVLMQTEFRSNEPEERSVASLAGFAGAFRGRYEPATEEEIRRYQDREYPHWLSKCESLLSNLHSSLQEQQPRPYFEFAVSNVGTRPARDVLITFVAQGDFRISVEPYSGTEETDEQVQDPLGFPEPPQAPAGRWTGQYGDIRSMASAFGSLKSILGDSQDYGYLLSKLDTPSRDPNGFYYKPQRPINPTDSFSLVCEQWRHRTEREVFNGDFHFDLGEEETDGAIACEIHAENLTRPLRKVVPVRIRTTRTGTNSAIRDLFRRLQGPFPAK